jgi:hypothetical protein
VLAAAAALGALSLCSAAPSFAARPAAAGRYLWNANNGGGAGVLQFSPDGRRITSDGWESPTFFDYYGSYVTATAACPDFADVVLDVKFGKAAGQSVAVSRAGTFRASVAGDGSDTNEPDATGRITLNGIVLGRTKVLVTFSGRMTWSPTPGQSESCPIPAQRAVFHLQHEPRFVSCTHHPGHTLLRTRAGFVYRARGEDEDGSSPWAYACLIGGRQIPLAPMTYEATTESTLYDFRLTRTHVRYTQEIPIEFADPATHTVTVDLRGYGRLISDKWLN